MNLFLLAAAKELESNPGVLKIHHYFCFVLFCNFLATLTLESDLDDSPPGQLAYPHWRADLALSAPQILGAFSLYRITTHNNGCAPTCTAF